MKQMAPGVSLACGIFLLTGCSNGSARDPSDAEDQDGCSGERMTSALVLASSFISATESGTSTEDDARDPVLVPCGDSLACSGMSWFGFQKAR